MTINSHQLRSRLQSERRRLIEDLEQLKATIPTGDWREGNPLKCDEGATDIFELERCLALQARITDSLAEVERALHKFDSGTYGFCDSCGQPIDPARSGTLPEPTLCVSCKTRQARDVEGRSSPAVSLRRFSVSEPDGEDPL